MAEIEITAEDVKAFERAGPRYTSYPTVPVWTAEVRETQYLEHLKTLTDSNELSLYIHLPFCKKLCHFCACNKIIDPEKRLADDYFKLLFQEIDLVSSHLNSKPSVIQLHYGGGTPTYNTPEELVSLTNKLKSQFRFMDSAELSLEANPVVTTREHLEALSRVGFNRISFGVQDFDPKVQEIINRNQSFEETFQLAETARELGFESVNVDMIYGLPLQSIATISDTVEKIEKIKPDRIAFYSFAKVPWKQPFQRKFKDEDLPEGLNKVNLYLHARKMLEQIGYQAVGMDHFALENDSLLKAQKAGKLHRNFMGYTTHPQAQMIGIGISSISMLDSIYVQNHRQLSQYKKCIENSELPVDRGIVLQGDDKLRRQVIMQLMCNFHLNWNEIENEFSISAKEVFKNEMEELKKFEEMNLLQMADDSVQVLPRGQVLVRNIAMTFDRYLDKNEKAQRFSQTI